MLTVCPFGTEVRAFLTVRQWYSWHGIRVPRQGTGMLLMPSETTFDQQNAVLARGQEVGQVLAALLAT